MAPPQLWVFRGHTAALHACNEKQHMAAENATQLLQAELDAAQLQAQLAEAQQKLAQSLLAAPLSAARAGGQLKPRARHGMVASRNPAPFHSGQQHSTQSSHIATKRTAAAAARRVFSGAVLDVAEMQALRQAAFEERTTRMARRVAQEAKDALTASRSVPTLPSIAYAQPRLGALHARPELHGACGVESKNPTRAQRCGALTRLRPRPSTQRTSR